MRFKLRTSKLHALTAFTLLEVMIACAIFFIVGFALLEMVTRGLSAARSLQQHEPDIGMIAGLFSTNTVFEEGDESGDFEDIAPGIYKDYQWALRKTEVGSNGLYQVDIVVYRNARGKGPNETRLSILKFCPNCKPGSATRPQL